MNGSASMNGSLADMMAALSKAQQGEFLAECAEEMAPIIEALVRDEFATSSDPYDSTWAPVKRGGAPLVLTGALSASWISVAGKDFFRISTGIDYASYHQSGTSRIVPRMMVPNDGALPSYWESQFVDAAERVFDRLVASASGGAGGGQQQAA